MAHIEYKCKSCGENYLPGEPGDGHDYKADGTECFSLNFEYAGFWVAPGETLSNRDQHIWEFWDCKDPDCEFHHPEL